MTEKQIRNVLIFADTMNLYTTHAKLAQAVLDSRKNTVLYEADDYPEVTGANHNRACTTTVTKHRTLQAAVELRKKYPGAKIAVLNFASAVQPGGGVTAGANAQEEGLCRCSTLYPVLDQKELWEKYYMVNRNVHNPLNTDACIFSPDIVVCKSDDHEPECLPEKDWVYTDVITCAAPNLRSVPYNSYNPQAGNPVSLSPDEQYTLHRQRIRHILHVAALHHEDVLVLGAFGCGAFRNDPDAVARAFKDALQEYQGYFTEVEFAIFCRRLETANYDAFVRAFQK